MTRIADSWMDQFSDNHTDNTVGMKKSAYRDYIIRNQDEGRLVEQRFARSPYDGFEHLCRKCNLLLLPLLNLNMSSEPIAAFEK